VYEDVTDMFRSVAAAVEAVMGIMHNAIELLTPEVVH
jgi:hypothetical protein